MAVAGRTPNSRAESTSFQISSGVAARTLVHRCQSYQRTFTAPLGPGSS
jgi:hypothetical protein